jgi:hypothetical protein
MPFLLTALGFAKGFIAKLSPSQLIIAALVMLAAFQHFHAKRIMRHDIATTRALGRERDAHTADIARWKAGAAASDDANRERVATVEAKYKEQNDEAKAYLTGRLELLRRQLRGQGGNDQSRPGGPDLPPADNPTGTTGQAGVCLSPEVILRGAENEERHDELISLILRQVSVDPNKP